MICKKLMCTSLIISMGTATGCYPYSKNDIEIKDASLAQFAGVETGVVVVADALSCGLSGRALIKLNKLHSEIEVVPVLLTKWPKTGKQQAEMMFSMPYRISSYDDYASSVENVFREMNRPLMAVFRKGQLVSVFGNMNSDIIVESLLDHLESLGVSPQEKALVT